MPSPQPHDAVTPEEGRQAYASLHQEVAQRLVGQEELFRQVLIALLARGHVLLDGVPGLAKSLVVHSLAQALGLRFRRLRCTADLTPHDVTGQGRSLPDSAAGPIFAHCLLVEELQQAPPRVQSTLFEALAERTVVLQGQEHALDEPFFVAATHNPQEESVPPLGPAQRDQFLLSIPVDYPRGAEEWALAERGGTLPAAPLRPVLTGAAFQRLQRAVNEVRLAPPILGLAWTLVRATRPTAPEAPEFVDRWIAWGAGPRGLLALIQAAKARALLAGRAAVERDDLAALAVPALRHRIVANPAAEANALTPERLIQMIWESLPAEGDLPVPPGMAELA